MAVQSWTTKSLVHERHLDKENVYLASRVANNTEQVLDEYNYSSKYWKNVAIVATTY